jgi:hypothetical protein
MIVVWLVAQNLLHTVDNPPIPTEQAIKVIARVIPKREANAAPFTITAAVRLLVKRLIALRGITQQVDLIEVEKPRHNDVPMALVSGEIVRR